MYVLGIDAGGTRTICLLADDAGQIRDEARGPGANLQAAGELVVEKVLHQAMRDAIGARPTPPAAICLGMAGVDRDEDAATVRGIMQRIGHTARTIVINDALIALVAGIGDAPGVVVVAGTGSIAYGRNAAGAAARAGGWGYVLGDEGSGYWIGRLALRAVLRQADGRGRSTRLTERVLTRYGLSRPQDLVHEVYINSPQPSAIAELSTDVQAAADEGDEIASGILESGGRELAAAAVSVARRLDLTASPFPVVLAGGVLRGVPRLADALTDRLRELAPKGYTKRLDREPALGAVHLALAETRGGATLPSYAR